MCSCLHIQVEQGKSTEIFLVEKSNITKCLDGNDSEAFLPGGKSPQRLWFKKFFICFSDKCFTIPNWNIQLVDKCSIEERKFDAAG